MKRNVKQKRQAEEDISKKLRKEGAYCAQAASLKSRSMISIISEAKRLVERGTKELLVISQDTSAYGLDLKYEEVSINGKKLKTNIYNLVNELSSLGVWVRLHYIYPYPHVKKLIPLMNENTVLPYLDVPFQHAHPDVLKRMVRPSNHVHDLEQISKQVYYQEYY